MNEQDPLSQLRDIHMPDPQGWWPPAPGWWILAALLLAAFAVAAYLVYRHWRGRVYRRLARAELDAAWQGLQADGDRAGYLQALNRILRRVARQSYPDYPLNRLQGEPWLAFLDQCLPARRQTTAHVEQFRTGSGRLLLTAPYQPNGAITGGNELQSLHELATSWIDRHDARSPAQPEYQPMESRHAGI